MTVDGGSLATLTNVPLEKVPESAFGKWRGSLPTDGGKNAFLPGGPPGVPSGEE